MKNPFPTLSFVGVLALGGAPLAAQSNEPVEIIFRADGKEITVQVQGDETTVRVDGKVVTDKRAKKRGNTVTINDESGSPLAYLSRVGQGLSFQRPLRSNRAAIGINVGTMPNALAEHLGLKRGDVIYVTGATKGRAAAKAGIKAHDIILEIDGEAPVSERKLRSILKQKKPGAKLGLTILRKGKKKDVVVKCDRANASSYYPAAWDINLLNQGFPRTAANPASIYGFSDLLRRQSKMKSTAAFGSAIKALQDVQKKHLKDSKDKKALDAFRKAIDSLKKANSSYLDAYNSLMKSRPTAFEALPVVPELNRTNPLVNPKLNYVWPRLTYDYFDQARKGAKKAGASKGKDLAKLRRKVAKKTPNPTNDPYYRPSGKPLSKQLSDLQERLARLEKMLQKLTDQKKIR